VPWQRPRHRARRVHPGRPTGPADRGSGLPRLDHRRRSVPAASSGPPGERLPGVDGL